MCRRGPETASETARSIETAAAEASTYLRAAMHSLLPADDALPVTMRRDVAVFSTRPVHAGAEAEDVLVSALREGLHNVEKHAGAGAILVSLAYQSHQLSLAIEDDGKGLPAGFDLHPVPGRDAGLGIPSLLQRVSGGRGAPPQPQRRRRGQPARHPPAGGMRMSPEHLAGARVSTVLIADDHPLVAHGIDRVLATASDEFAVVAACHSGRETLIAAAARQPDLVLLDVRLGDMNGAEVCLRLGAEVPRARTVMLTAFDDTENLRRCLEAGAAGALLKGSLDLDLPQALRDIRDGRMVIDAGVARALEAAGGILGPDGTTVPQLRPRELTSCVSWPPG